MAHYLLFLLCNTIRYYNSTLRVNGDHVRDSSGWIDYDFQAGGASSDVHFFMDLNDRNGHPLVFTNLSTMWDFGEPTINGALKVKHEFIYQDMWMEIWSWDALMAMEYANQDMTLEVSNHNQGGSETFFYWLDAGQDGMTTETGSWYV
jgi:hypothetical protein